MNDPGTDKLSQFAHDLINSADYRKLVVTEGTAPAAWQALGKAGPDELLGAAVTNYAAGYAMIAGLWLRYDALHESHEIAQKSPGDLHRAALKLHRPPSKLSQLGEAGRPVDPPAEPSAEQLREMTATLSFWHAIMHRREGDFGNSQYWYAKCPEHPVFKSLGPRANDLIHPLPADKSLLRLVANGWDPDAFVDLVRQVDGRPGDPRHELAVKLQQAEWGLLFEYCSRRAVEE